MISYSINKPDGYQFKAMSEELHDLAIAHMHKSGRYAAEGNYHNADGSAAKAARKFLQAEKLQLPPMSPAEAKLMREIENAFMNGI
jgi:hypothetical protein